MFQLYRDVFLLKPCYDISGGDSGSSIYRYLSRLHKAN